jgi:hypothetical protein
MRIFANLFLILFLADGGVSLVDELVSLLAPVTLLSGVRNCLTDTVMIAAVPLYFCLGIDRRLPKRLFLPLIIFVVWCPLSTWLFPALAGIRSYGVLMSAGQVILCMLLVSRFRAPGEQIQLLPKALFDAPFFSLKNTLIFGTANLLVVPLVLLLFVMYAANAFMEDYTSGFVRLAPDGLRMVERVYRRDNRTIRLAAMIHMGEQEYYDELARSVVPGRTIVLAEGVTDDDNLLQNRFDYGKLAGFLGLASQDKMLFRGKLIEPYEFEKLRPRSRGTGERNRPEPDILRADVDVNSFRLPTIRLLDELGKHLKDGPSPVKGLLSFNAWAEENITPEMNDVILDDILYRRNREVIRQLGKALDRYDTIVIPWGALHMAEIEEEVLGRGFELQQERERVSVDFKKMIVGRFW